MRASPRTLAAAASLALAIFAAAGCFNPFRPTVSNGPTFVAPAPVPDSPQNVVLLFKWCWENRDYNKYRTIFTADYQFAFALTDSAGSAYRSTPWVRDDEMLSAQHLFVGGSATEPAASTITLTFNSTLTPQPDLRPGKTYPVHQSINISSLTLIVQKPDGTGYQVSGGALFYLVRGDSALIPSDINLRPDANRWYIERWEDQTNQGAIASALRRAGVDPAALVTSPPPVARPPRTPVDPFYQNVTAGWLKNHYLN
jgi:hypothetical protein